jgi:type II secretory ATPase GspE/PulE/Tfp pilus assembly ATPase PilB-like protein
MLHRTVNKSDPSPSLAGRASRSSLGRPLLGRILVEEGSLSSADLDAAVNYQNKHECRFGEAVVALGFCTEVEVAKALAAQLDMPFVNLATTPLDEELTAGFPRAVAMQYGVLPVRKDRGRILVAALNPSDIRIDEAVRQHTGFSVITAIAPESQLRERLHQYYGSPPVPLPAQAPVSQGLRRAELSLEAGEIDQALERLRAAAEQVTASQAIDALVADAVRQEASDLHLEPQEDRIRVRYRMDGVMIPVVDLPRSLLASIAARAKVMGEMDLSENRKPQDGGCCVEVRGRTIELRISTLPGVYGENLVIRLLSRDAGLQELDSLGMEPDMLKQFRRLLLDKHGMVLTTGPTGSGKTTTLYAALAALNRDGVKIITVEDPVEVRLPGVCHVQVDDRAGRSFGSTLRAMLRQDPDVLMIGEIRDIETAENACRAALTGHLVLSTLHTRHAFGTLARLVDIGLARYTVAASVNGIVAQRLVRRVCHQCAAPHAPSSGVLQLLKARYGSVSEADFRLGSGCAACRGTGMRGRMGVYELLVIDDELRRALAEPADFGMLRGRASERGFRTLGEDAFRKACQGLIPAEEVVQLSSWTPDQEEAAS